MHLVRRQSTIGCRGSKSLSANVHLSRDNPMNESRGYQEKGCSVEGSEEEKKEGTPQQQGNRRSASSSATKGQPNPFASAQVDLPAVFVGKKYVDESSFLKDLEPHSDLRIVLNDQGYAVWQEMPGDGHNTGMEIIVETFQSWAARTQCGVKGKENVNIRLTRTFSPKRIGRERHPDYALYGPDRLLGKVVRTHQLAGETVPKLENPHVAIQFGWANEDTYETYAIDDMMNYAGVRKYSALKRPVVAYFIKAMWKGQRGESPLYGFNIYEIRPDGRRQDVQPTLYRVGVDGQEEGGQVVVAPEDMGVTVTEDNEVEPFTIDVHEIRQVIESVGLGVFEPEDPD